MKVALVKPPKIQNSVRGVGVYTTSLYEELSKIPDLHISLEEFDLSGIGYKNFDLVHFPYFDFFFLTLPVFKSAKFVVTVHDLIPLLFPANFPPGIKGAASWHIQKKLLERADGLIAVSQNTAGDIVKLLNFSKQKVTVIYEAAGDIFGIIKDKQILQATREKHHLSERYLLYVGDVNYNKNISNLIRAFKKVTEEFKDINLILIGKSFQGNIPESINLKKEINKLGLNNRVRMPGFVSQEDLVFYYNLASLYIQPSIYEGFGLPVLEAMSCGTPVVCGKNSSFPEIGGNAAIFTNVQNPDQFAQTIIKSLTLSPAKKDQLRKKGLEQAHKFSWEKAAGETCDLYEKICSK